jgi:hypothetical protein
MRIYLLLLHLMLPHLSRFLLQNSLMYAAQSQMHQASSGEGKLAEEAEKLDEEWAQHELKTVAY